MIEKREREREIKAKSSRKTAKDGKVVYNIKKETRRKGGGEEKLRFKEKEGLLITTETRLHTYAFRAVTRSLV